MPNANYYLPVQERFDMKVDRSGECHRWTAVHDSFGYGRFRYEGRLRPAHVVALLLAGVEIPPGMTVDHVWARGCQHKDCVRIDHLEVVTHRENGLRGNSACAINARKTHCLRGHEYTPENTKPHGPRGRNCRQCIRDKHRAKVEAQRSGAAR